MTTPDAPPAEAALRVAIRLFLRHCRATRAPSTAPYYQERLATFDRWLDAAGLLAPPDRRRPSQPLNASLYQALRPGTIDRFVEAMRATTYANALTATPRQAAQPSHHPQERGRREDLRRLAPASESEIEPFSDAQVVALVTATASWTRSRRGCRFGVDGRSLSTAHPSAWKRVHQR